MLSTINKTRKETFYHEIYSKPQRKISAGEILLRGFHDTWCLIFLSLLASGTKSNRGFRTILCFTDNFNKFGCTLPMKKKRHKQEQTEPTLSSGKQKSDRNWSKMIAEQILVFKNIEDFLILEAFRKYFSSTSEIVALAESFDKTIRVSLKNRF